MLVRRLLTRALERFHQKYEVVPSAITRIVRGR